MRFPRPTPARRHPATLLAAAALGLALTAGTLPAAAAPPSPSLAAAVVPATTAPAEVQRDPDHPGVLVNRQHVLSPLRYAPPLRTAQGSHQLQPSAAYAFRMMAKAAAADGVGLRITSSYRSYAYQQNLYAGYVERWGHLYTNTVSAQPGTSEHQTGLAIDVATPAGVVSWMRQNAHRYGYILRYPEGQSSITGYRYEPWHYRYVGSAVAKAMKAGGTPTLEHHYGVAAPTPASRYATVDASMRAWPGAGHRLVTVVPKGHRMLATGKVSRGWHQVRYGTMVGWVPWTALSGKPPA